MKNEPLITIATITAGGTAVLGLLVAFGVPITEGQQVAILGVVAVVAPVVVALIGRGLVTPNGRVVERVDPSGQVLAGEANELETDTPIREIGTEVEPDDQTEAIVDNPYVDQPEG